MRGCRSSANRAGGRTRRSCSRRRRARPAAASPAPTLARLMSRQRPPQVAEPGRVELGLVGRPDGFGDRRMQLARRCFHARSDVEALPSARPRPRPARTRRPRRRRRRSRGCRCRRRRSWWACPASSAWAKIATTPASPCGSWRGPYTLAGRDVRAVQVVEVAEHVEVDLAADLARRVRRGRVDGHVLRGRVDGRRAVDRPTRRGVHHLADAGPCGRPRPAAPCRRR